jgi:hypothetical protein
MYFIYWDLYLFVFKPALKYPPWNVLFNYFPHVFNHLCVLFIYLFIQACPKVPTLKWLFIYLNLHLFFQACPKVPALKCLFDYFLHVFNLFNYVCWNLKLFHFQACPKVPTLKCLFLHLFKSEFIYSSLPQVPTSKCLFLHLFMYLFKPALKYQPSSLYFYLNLTLFIPCLLFITCVYFINLFIHLCTKTQVPALKDHFIYWFKSDWP